MKWTKEMRAAAFLPIIDGALLDDVANRFGISKERVRQVNIQTMRAMFKALDMKAIDEHGNPTTPYFSTEDVRMRPAFWREALVEWMAIPEPETVRLCACCDRRLSEAYPPAPKESEHRVVWRLHSSYVDARGPSP